MSKKLIAFAHVFDDPDCRFRIRQFIPALEQAGWSVSLRTNRPPRPWESPYRNPLMQAAHRRAGMLLRRLRKLRDIDAAANYDAVFVNRDLLAADIRYEQRLLQRNRRVIFDFDDAIFLNDRAAHFKWFCEQAAWVTAGNKILAAKAREFTDRVTLLPTVVDTDAYLASSQGNSANGPMRIGWLGSGRSIRETLFPYLSMLARLQAELGFTFVIISRPRPEIECPGLEWSYVEWTPEIETRSCEFFDVGIMPLVDDEFQRGKCGCKILQYMASGLPVVASPVGINSSLIVHGARGFLADSEDEWRKALTELGSSLELRQRLGAAGRGFVEAEYSLKVWFPVLLESLEKVSRLSR